MSASPETPRPTRPPAPTATAQAMPPGPAPSAESGAGSFRAALGLAGLGAVLIGLAPLVGVVSPVAAPAFLSWPVLLLLAAIAPVLAWWFERGGRRATAAAVLLGPAVLAPGRFVLDTQLLVDAGRAARPELLLTSTLEPLEPSAGTWMLLAAHVASATAGVLVLRWIVRTAESRASSDGTVTHRQGLLAVVLLAAVVAAVGLTLMPFESDNPYLLPRSALDVTAPTAVLVGSFLMAVAVPVAGGFAATAADPDVVRGGLLGLGLGVLPVSLAPLLAVTFMSDVRFSWGPLLGVLAALTLAALARWTGTASSDETEVRLPALARLLRLAAAAGMLAGVLAVAAALLPQITLPDSADAPSSYPARPLLPAGVVLALLAAGVAMPRAALWLRPALVVGTAVVPLAAAASLDTVFAALSVDGARMGAGAWAAVAALVFAATAAVLGALAGGVERDDVDLTEVRVRTEMLLVAVPAAVLAVLAFAFPVLTAPDYSPPGLFHDVGTTSWGLLLGLVAVLAAVALATVCRPSRAAALLSGAVLVVAVRVLELPLTAGRAEASSAGLGLWCGLACAGVLVVGAFFAARSPESTE
ncbi:hypothetical protein GIY23_19705 [Allosaccharopolyspora coralli]|uniref:Uncharacterized protein n=1 Tax=Allosaccharopolyspora coralli TaxID=2665642 RepID=A0A5Q3QA48_9PSEU|nr:hypothetical protein [Allosaccharopolyspora coralli]QGK71438.1 hypothetical protein GIY23_19705 [Allosaccharopolyspora coralli]